MGFLFKRWVFYLKDGLGNVFLTEETMKYIAFVAPKKGIFRLRLIFIFAIFIFLIFMFDVLPFGLKTSPTIFQRIMENILMDLIDIGTVCISVFW